MEPLSELTAESNVASTPARPRALPTPGYASGRPVSDPVMDRSDTVSSIKSLDRWEMTRHARSPNSISTADSSNARPLPLPQVSAAKSGLAPSRSLDRGIPRHGGFLGMANTISSRTPEVRPATGDIVTSSRILPTAPSAERIVRSQKEGSTSCKPAIDRQPRQTPTDVGLGTVEEGAQFGEAQGSDHITPTRKEEPVVTIAVPLPVIVFPDPPEVPEISVTESVTPSIPCVSVDPPGSPRKTSPDIDSCINVDVDGLVPNLIISDGSGPSVSLTEAAQPAVVALPNPSPSSANHSGPGIFCSACDLVILGSIINAAGKRWHPDCLRCTTCGVGLEHVSRYDHEGMPYCHMDYHEVSTYKRWRALSSDPFSNQQFAPKCHHCNTPIVDQRYITIDDASLGQRFYHELHFFCGECGIPFLDPSRSSAAGTEKRSGETNLQENPEDDDETAAFVIHGKYAFCPDCDIKLHRVKCKRCKLAIKDQDQALKALGSSWHKECFKCAVSLTMSSLCHCTF
jgi:paxillin